MGFSNLHPPVHVDPPVYLHPPLFAPSRMYLRACAHAAHSGMAAAGDTDADARLYTHPDDLPEERIPSVASKFESHDAAVDFVNSYAGCSGFSMRLGKVDRAKAKEGHSAGDIRKRREGQRLRREQEKGSDSPLAPTVRCTSGLAVTPHQASGPLSRLHYSTTTRCYHRT